MTMKSEILNEAIYKPDGMYILGLSSGKEFVFEYAEEKNSTCVRLINLSSSTSMEVDVDSSSIVFVFRLSCKEAE